MKSKATHIGECQLCGHIQKLPNGRLAKHGYRVLSGFFSGTCPGSLGTPYEQSYDLIEFGIQRTQKRIDELELEIQGQVDGTGPLMAHICCGHPHHGYRWLTEDNFKILENGRIQYTTPFSSIERINPMISGCYSKTDTIALCRDQRIKFLQKLVKEGTDYITWCKNRITNWTLKELQSIAK